MIILTITFVTSVAMASVIFSNASSKPWLPGPAGASDGSWILLQAGCF